MITKKKIYYFIIAIILIMISEPILRALNLNDVYFHVINPLFWLLFSIVWYFFIGYHTIFYFRYKKVIIEWIIIIILIYYFLYFGLGIISGFGYNPYDNSISGFIINFWTIGIVIIGQEYIRTIFMQQKNFYNNFIRFIIIIPLYSIIEIKLSSFLDISVLEFNFIFNILLPIINKHLLLTYICTIGGCLPVIFYQLGINIIYWWAPILPEHSFLIAIIFSYLIPLISMWLIYYLINSNKLKRRELQKINPMIWLPKLLLIFGLITFLSGFWPIAPTSILSNSMVPAIKRGDVVITKKTNANDIKEGHIIKFVRDHNIIIHRVVDIDYKNEKELFVTKGDNNKTKDKKPVTANQLLGRVIFIIPKIGYPSVWFRSIIAKISKL
ncbi:MAG: signal peptidase I [Bacilli bacterium]|jgi:signal peptidase|nr:signal peptidase I [Bacilli bacterium]